jgi:hypothetical protein
MPERLSTRGERVERLIEILAEKQTRLDDVLVVLTEAQIKNEGRFDQIADRFRDTDDRIDKLVSAIGEMLRTRNGGTHQ